MKKMELLAPAGDAESFYAAINNGANAIYLGLQDFNARNHAVNFTKDNIRQFVEYAHLFDVKIYVTLNTLIKDSEITLLLEAAKSAVDAKVDAFIVQDLGVALLLKRNFPNIVLHASTQMGIHNLQGALIAKKIGFSRIVLSRETTAEDIKQIKQQTDLEVEYFVQGALCVAFSGNCYLSSLCHNESGNCGRCLQLCRLPYTAYEDNKQIGEGYLLSTADLSYIDKLQYLSSLGIDSLKIEGRMRRAGYVAGIVKEYRYALNNLPYDKNVIKKLFYRGEYNDGKYLDKNIDKNIINTKFQNHYGIMIGKVINVQPFKDIYSIIIQSNHKIMSGDGLKFVNNNLEKSIGVGNVDVLSNNQYRIYSKTNPVVNSTVYLILDNEMETSLLKNKLKIQITAEFHAKIGEYPQLILKYEKISSKTILDIQCEKAKTQGLSIDDVSQSLSKTKDTPFEINDITCDIENVFMTKSQLNELRRVALDDLKSAILNEYEQNIKSTSKKQFDLTYSKSTNNMHNYLIVDEILLNNLTINETTNYRIAFAPKIWTKNVLKSALLIINALNKEKMYLYLPIIMTFYDWKNLTDAILEIDKKSLGFIANNIGALTLTDNYEVIGGYALNITNNYAKEVIASFDITEFTHSIENVLTYNEGISYVGKPSLMTFRHCPYQTVYGNINCENCKYNNKDITYQMQNNKFMIRRIKQATCSFEFIGETETKNTTEYIMKDLRR